MPAGRPKGSVNKYKFTATEVALAVLSRVDQVDIWEKHIRNKDPRISLEALKYMCDRLWGRPAQTLSGELNSKVSITLQWASAPEWIKPQDVIEVQAHDTTTSD